MPQRRLAHILLREQPENRIFTSTQSGGERHIPARARGPHSKLLKNRLAQAWQESESEQVVAHVERHGVYLEFKSDPGVDLVTKSLEDMRSKKVRLLNIRTEEETISRGKQGQLEDVGTTYATVFLAHDKKDHFLKKIEDYAQKDTPKGRPKHADLINSIAISPRVGWWRERAHLNRWGRRTRYTLVASITTPEESVDVYTPVANQVGIAVPIGIAT